VRMGYTSRLNRHNQAIGRRDFEPVAISVFWSTRGEASLGAFADGTWRRCAPDDHCINLSWPDMLAGYGGIQGRRSFWHGTLVEDKSDGSGLKFRRNRYYDPASGRFTQEDPIGLAGGVNVYGYGGGDPVNFRDPFGLNADTLEAVLVTHRSREVPQTKYGTLCVDRSVRDDVQQIYDLAVSKGIPVDFNNAFRDRVTVGTGGRPGAGGSSQHLSGFAFDINSSSLTPAQNAEFTRIAGMYGFTPVRGDPGHYQVTGGGAKRYGSHQAAVAEASRSYAAGECVDDNVEAVRGQ
jgi:RHS repeat-associated protein